MLTAMLFGFCQRHVNDDASIRRDDDADIRIDAAMIFLLDYCR